MGGPTCMVCTFPAGFGLLDCNLGDEGQRLTSACTALPHCLFRRRTGSSLGRPLGSATACCSWCAGSQPAIAAGVCSFELCLPAGHQRPPCTMPADWPLLAWLLCLPAGPAQVSAAADDLWQRHQQQQRHPGRQRQPVCLPSSTAVHMLPQMAAAASGFMHPALAPMAAAGTMLPQATRCPPPWQPCLVAGRRLPCQEPATCSTLHAGRQGALLGSSICHRYPALAI